MHATPPTLSLSLPLQRSVQHGNVNWSNNCGSFVVELNLDIIIIHCFYEMIMLSLNVFFCSLNRLIFELKPKTFARFGQCIAI